MSQSDELASIEELATGFTLIDLDVRRWDSDLDEADDRILERCEGSTLDIGCGPGRLVAGLAAQGKPALGVDVAHWAVASARSAGALALHRSVFDRIPGTGRWTTALLADGNIGIGGDPGSLLGRVTELLEPGGLLLCEVEVEDVDERMLMRLVALDGSTTHPVPWARVGLPALHDVLLALGYSLVESWTVSDRRFCAARTPAVTAVTTTTTPTATASPRG